MAKQDKPIKKDNPIKKVKRALSTRASVINAAVSGAQAGAKKPAKKPAAKKNPYKKGTGRYAMWARREAKRKAK
jgi:hypothetical protein